MLDIEQVEKVMSGRSFDKPRSAKITDRLLASHSVPDIWTEWTSHVQLILSKKRSGLAGLCQIQLTGLKRLNARHCPMMNISADCMISCTGRWKYCI